VTILARVVIGTKEIVAQRAADLLLVSISFQLDESGRTIDELVSVGKIIAHFRCTIILPSGQAIR
jgi:hypothetical protein